VQTTLKRETKATVTEEERQGGNRGTVECLCMDGEGKGKGEYKQVLFLFLSLSLQSVCGLFVVPCVLVFLYVI